MINMLYNLSLTSINTMPRSSLSYTLISDAALGSLNALGKRLKEARLLRNWTQADIADKAGLSESSVRKVEAGSPHITVGAYLALLDVLGLPTAFDRVIAPGVPHRIFAAPFP